MDTDEQRFERMVEEMEGRTAEQRRAVLGRVQKLDAQQFLFHALRNEYVNT